MDHPTGVAASEIDLSRREGAAKLDRHRHHLLMGDVSAIRKQRVRHRLHSSWR
jgi:hypothetical protein